MLELGLEASPPQKCYPLLSSSPTAAQPPSSDMNMFVRRFHCLHPSLPLNKIRTTSTCTPLTPSQSQASSPNSNPNPNPNPQCFAVQYLVQSFGLSSDKALKASKYIQYLKSPDKPDMVLRFLREIGISESAIKAAVPLEARILCTHIDKIWKPNIAKLQEIGFTIEDISGFIASHPYPFASNFVPQIDFWMGVLGSVENFSLLFKVHWCNPFSSNLEKVLMPNLSFLVEQCGFSPCRIIQLMKKNSRLFSFRPDVLKMQVERAEKLGFDRSSAKFINALSTFFYLNDSTIDARLNNFRSMGLSQEEVALMIIKSPTLLKFPEKLIGNKMEYLIKEAGCDKTDVVTYPALFTYSLEKRLIPRNIVKKLLMSKGILEANKKFAPLIQISEKRFVKRFVLPYEHDIPGLHQAYFDASTGIIGGVESFKSILT